MVAARLHAIGRNGPGPRFQIELIPGRQPNLAGARRGQNGRFKREPPHRFLRAELNHELWQLGVGQRRMVPCFRPLLRQALVNYRHRQRPIPISLGDRPIDHSQNSLAEPTRTGTRESAQVTAQCRERFNRNAAW